MNDVNDQPTDISLSSNAVAENSPNGTIIGNLTTTDQDSGETHTFLITNSIGKLSSFAPFHMSPVFCTCFVIVVFFLYKTLHDAALVFINLPMLNQHTKMKPSNINFL